METIAFAVEDKFIEFFLLSFNDAKAWTARHVTW